MASPTRGQTVRGIDYAATFAFTDIFRAFKIATQPGKLTIALGLVIIMFVVGWLLDGLVGGGRVPPDEFNQFVQRESISQFRHWRQTEADQLPARLANQLRKEADLDVAAADAIAGDEGARWTKARQAIVDRYGRVDERMSEVYADNPEGLADYRAQADRQRALALDRVERLKPAGVFGEALRIKIAAFQGLIDGARTFHIGWDQLDPTRPVDTDRPSIVGSVRIVAYELPAWLWHAHPWFLLLWMVVFVAVWSLLGGAICRLCVVDAATGDRLQMSDGVHYAFRRWLNFALAPLLPLIVVGLLALALALGGLLFHVPGLDVVGAALMVAAIPIGLLMAFFIVGWLGGVHLMYPALGAEGTDAFDAVSRAYSYVLARPWRFILYTLISLVYGVATYLFVGLFIFLTLYLVQCAGSAWSEPLNRVFPAPQFGQLRYDVELSGLGATERIAAAVIKVYVLLAVGLVAAYAVSFYFSAYSLVYLALRRRCDGTDTGEVYIERDTAGDAPPKVEAADTPAEPTVDRADEA